MIVVEKQTYDMSRHQPILSLPSFIMKLFNLLFSRLFSTIFKQCGSHLLWHIKDLYRQNNVTKTRDFVLTSDAFCSKL